MWIAALDHQPLDLIFNAPDLTHQFTALIRCDTCSNDGSRNPTCSAQGYLAVYENVRNILVLTQQREVQQDGQRRTVRGQDDNLSNPPIERLRRLIGAFLEKSCVGALLHQVEEFGVQGLVCAGPGGGCVLLVGHYARDGR